MRIGDVELDNNIILAPMAGVNNNAFRSIVSEFGAGLVTSEMISDKALLYNNKITKKMIEVAQDERPISLQIFGSEKESLVEAAKIIDTMSSADIIDINMGCPVPKVTKTGAGSKWLIETNKIEDVLKEIIKAVHKPVTVKMRTGWDSRNINIIDNARAAQNAGVSAIAVHGRTREQMYSGKADWDIIAQVKNMVTIPVIGNGDIYTPEDAKKMIEQTNVDGVMIGRGALGNPWIFSRTVKYLRTGVLDLVPTPEEKLRVILIHMDRLTEIKGEILAIKEMRKHVAWYLKGLPQAARIRAEINKVVEKEDMIQLLKSYLGELKI